MFDPANPFVPGDVGASITIYGGRGPLPDGTYTVGQTTSHDLSPGQPGTQQLVTTTVVPAVYAVPGRGIGLWVRGAASAVPAAANAILLAGAIIARGLPGYVATMNQAMPVTVSLDGNYTGTVTPTASVAGTFAPASASLTAQSSAAFLFTPSAIGPQNGDGMGSATLSATIAGIAVTPLVVSLAPVTTPPTATKLVAP